MRYMIVKFYANPLARYVIYTKKTDCLCKKYRQGSIHTPGSRHFRSPATPW